MRIQHQQNGSKGIFFIEEYNKRLAEMTYTIAAPDILIIDHTEVDDLLRGKNVGFTLVTHAAGFAREHNYRIIPLCPFAKAIMEKNNSLFTDVLKH